MNSEKMLAEIRGHAIALHAHLRVMSAVMLRLHVPKEEFAAWQETVAAMEADLRKALKEADPDRGHWPDPADWWRNPPGMN